MRPRVDDRERETTNTSRRLAKKSRYFRSCLESCGNPGSAPPCFDCGPAPAPPRPRCHTNAINMRKVPRKLASGTDVKTMRQGAGASALSLVATERKLLSVIHDFPHGRPTMGRGYGTYSRDGARPTHGSGVMELLHGYPPPCAQLNRCSWAEPPAPPPPF